MNEYETIVTSQESLGAWLTLHAIYIKKFQQLSQFSPITCLDSWKNWLEKVDVISQNKEKYVVVDNVQDREGKQKQVFLKLRFLDSFRFMDTWIQFQN